MGRLADFHEWETLTQSSGRRWASLKGYVSLNNCQKHPIEKVFIVSGGSVYNYSEVEFIRLALGFFLLFVTLNKQGLAKTRHVVAME